MLFSKENMERDLFLLFPKKLQVKIMIPKIEWVNKKLKYADNGVILQTGFTMINNA